MIEENGVKVIFVDYLQMMGTRKYGYNREAEISYISRELRSIALDFNVCIVVSSQLSRATETRPGYKRPLLSDLKESGAIEQDADKVIFLYRPEYYRIEEWDDDECSPAKNTAELIVAKNKNGYLDKVRVEIEEEFTGFKNYEYTFKNEFSFSQDRLNEMVTKNPALNDLIDKFDLDTDVPF